MCSVYLFATDAALNVERLLSENGSKQEEFRLLLAWILPDAELRLLGSTANSKVQDLYRTARHCRWLGKAYEYSYNIYALAHKYSYTHGANLFHE